MRENHEPEFSLHGLELLLCAEVNFDNVQKMQPVVSTNPIWALALRQLKQVIKDLEAEE